MFSYELDGECVGWEPPTSEVTIVLIMFRCRLIKVARVVVEFGWVNWILMLKLILPRCQQVVEARHYANKEISN